MKLAGPGLGSVGAARLVWERSGGVGVGWVRLGGDGGGAVNCELGPGSLNLGAQFTDRAFSVHRLGFTEYAVVPPQN